MPRRFRSLLDLPVAAFQIIDDRFGDHLLLVIAEPVIP
jgi:hypothetical protein